METALTMHVIARIRSPFGSKFGIPRQSALIDTVRSQIVFEPPYRSSAALRGLEGFSHIWLLWNFSQSRGWSPTVRPPRLGGNVRMGVFATRSPFRPNPIGLSCVRLERVEQNSPEGPILHILGADLMDGTPILDIKPYLSQVDAHPEALSGFTASLEDVHLEVRCPPALLERIPPGEREALLNVLAADPRPRYQKDPQRVYGFPFAGLEVKFTVDGTVLTVVDVE